GQAGRNHEAPRSDNCVSYLISSTSATLDRNRAPTGRYGAWNPWSVSPSRSPARPGPPLGSLEPVAAQLTRPRSPIRNRQFPRGDDALTQGSATAAVAASVGRPERPADRRRSARTSTPGSHSDNS